jgi:murein DD-endopeptidase MepM/ murein hydrolase activator NlpD
VTLDSEDSKRAEEETKKLETLWKTASPEKLWQGRFLKPIASDLSSGFGRRRIVNNQPRSPHSGIDLKAQVGTPIRAANHGRVVLADDFFFSGKTVVLDHGLGLYTYYGHCSKLRVQEGEFVQKGHVIAEVGSTGRVTGPHLHWACRLNGARINPMELTTYMLRD